MSGSTPGGRSGSRFSRGSGELVRLIWRLLVAQAIATAAVGLPFSRRQLPTILITLAMVVAVSGLAVLARSGTRTAWLVTLSLESAFFLVGLYQFMVARYLGGTLFALLAVGALAHPAVARAYGAGWGPAAREETAPSGSGEASPEIYAGEPLGEETFGGHPVG